MRRTVIAFNIVAPVAFFGLWLAGYFWIGLGILLAAHMWLLIGTLLPNSQVWGTVITRFETAKSELWLTIDDGPDPLDTPVLLDLLDAAGAKATFFLIGRKAKAHPGLVHEIVRRGHGIGNHTLNHPAYSFWRLGPASLRHEIESGAKVLASLGHPTSLFRAPAGMKNPFVHPLLKEAELTLLGWTCRGYDGTRSDPDQIVKLLEKGFSPGSILLIHESRELPDGERLAPILLRKLLRKAESQNLHFVLPDAASFRRR